MKSVSSIILIAALAIFSSCGSGDDDPNTSNEHFEILWEVHTPLSLPQGIILDEKGRNYIYVASKTRGLIVLDNNKSPARQVANVSTNSFGNHDAMHLTQQGDYLFIALGDFFSGNVKAGMAIIDVSNPEKPLTTDFWESQAVEEGSAIVIVKDDYAYLGAMSKGIYVFDVSDKNNIAELSQFVPDLDFPNPNPGSIQRPNARGMAIRANHLFVANDAGGIRVIDVSDKSNLREISKYINNRFNKQKAYNNILLNGDYAYVATDYCGMEILDISDVKNIQLASWCNPWRCDTPENNWFNSEGHTNQLVYDAQNKRVALSSGGSEITVMDVSDPENCKFISSLGTRDNNLGTWGLTMSGSKVYATYITTLIPFTGNWSGIKCIELQ